MGLGGRRGMVEVLVFGKEGCHLCEMVESEIRSLKKARANLTVVDIDDDEAYYAKYWMRIPVVVIDGREVLEAKDMDPEGRWKGSLSALLSR